MLKSKPLNSMTTYLEIYKDARREFNPKDSLCYVINEIKFNPGLLAYDRNSIIGLLLESCKNLNSLNDYNYLLLTTYLGTEVVNLFLNENTGKN